MYVGPSVSQDVSSDDKDGEDNDDVEIVAGRRPLKRRRSTRHTINEVGTSLSFWIGQQFKEMFGQSLMCKYKVGTRSFTRATSFFLSEICVSATVCQAQKFQELCFLVTEAMQEPSKVDTSLRCRSRWWRELQDSQVSAM